MALWIGGEDIAVINPANGQTLGSVPRSGREGSRHGTEEFTNLKYMLVAGI